jgi:hypothetical protein
VRDQGPDTRRHIPGIVLRAVAVTVLWGFALLAGMRSNVQGSLEMAAYGTLILFTLAIVVQLLILMWFEGRRP